MDLSFFYCFYSDRLVNPGKKKKNNNPTFLFKSAMKIDETDISARQSWHGSDQNYLPIVNKMYHNIKFKYYLTCGSKEKAPDVLFY